ncbi:hypothetical protein BUALT_Bualt15G0095000 [Buddleja alternifolia]|uniref:Uncharacterized protein n=1 Tax=Buddleja alternifolia TaxID=168488 RepID=A0AAV6WFR4_9LAMI|nr:hypothetical protein BUALT_Bualt15G0095000 [Buddleja alternifolia]
MDSNVSAKLSCVESRLEKLERCKRDKFAADLQPFHASPASEPVRGHDDFGVRKGEAYVADGDVAAALMELNKEEDMVEVPLDVDNQYPKTGVKEYPRRERKRSHNLQSPYTEFHANKRKATKTVIDPFQSQLINEGKLANDLESNVAEGITFSDEKVVLKEVAMEKEDDEQEDDEDANDGKVDSVLSDKKILDDDLESGIWYISGPHIEKFKCSLSLMKSWNDTIPYAPEIKVWKEYQNEADAISMPGAVNITFPRI